MIANRPCEVCKKYVFNPDGTIMRKPAHDPNGRLVELGNRKPPCDACPKIPKGVEPKPENAVELTPENWKAYRHWQGCDAVNWQGCEEGADATVRRNAAVIREVRDQVKREQELQWLSMVMVAGRMGGAKSGR